MTNLFRGSRRLSWFVDAGIILSIAAFLVWPYFQLKHSDKWASIESTFIADARFLHDHWPRPLWQPNWYTGTRFDYIYPPALRYGTAGLMKIYPKLIAAQAYHFYCAFFYCMGIAGVYVLVRIGAKSRGSAWVAALAAATISPCFLFMADIRNDAFHSQWVPQRLAALVRYGEGPHITALALLGFALAFSIPALLRGGGRWLAAAAVMCAMVVSNNFYGATSLAMLFPVILWSCWITHPKTILFARAAIVVILSYGLCAFWLVPSYLNVTWRNLQYVSERGNRWSLWLFLFLSIVYMKSTERWAKGKPALLWPVLLWGAAPLMFVNVIGNHYLGFRVIGEPGRMAPEFDLLVILAVVELLRRMWSAEPPFSWFGSLYARRVVAVALILLCWWPVRRYVFQPWRQFIRDPAYKERVEYRMTEWMHRNMPNARAYTSGSLRFWYNAWFDLPQLGGGSEQGMMNPVSMPATWNLGLDESGQNGIVWAQCLGVDALLVHDKTSEEPYHDVVHPMKFEGLAERVWADGKGNFIYRVPRRYPGLARVVEKARFDVLQTPAPEPTLDYLKALAAVLEQGPDAPTETRWEGPEELRIKARVAEGQTIFVQVSYDRPWRAFSGGDRLTMHRSQLGFIRIDAPPGDHDIRLLYTMPRENITGGILTILSIGLVLAMTFRPRRRAA